MKRAGRVHWMVVVALATLLLIAGFFVFSGENPEDTARTFMGALASGDAKTLAKLSYLNETGKGADEHSTIDQMEAKWKETTDGGQHYLFSYSVGDVQTQPDNTASVRVMVNRNLNAAGGYDEHFELPLIKEDGKWKVHVQAISRDMYPFLPR